MRGAPHVATFKISLFLAIVSILLVCQKVGFQWGLGLALCEFVLSGMLMAAAKAAKPHLSLTGAAKWAALATLLYISALLFPWTGCIAIILAAEFILQLPQRYESLAVFVALFSTLATFPVAGRIGRRLVTARRLP